MSVLSTLSAIEWLGKIKLKYLIWMDRSCTTFNLYIQNKTPIVNRGEIESKQKYSNEYQI